MTVATAAIVTLPTMVNDVDYGFDFVFWDDTDLSVPHDFPTDDVITLTLIAGSRSYTKHKYLSSDTSPKVSFSADNIISLRIPKATGVLIKPTTYHMELSRTGSDASNDLLAIGDLLIQAGYSPDAMKNAYGLSLGEVASANIIFTNAAAQIVYPSYAPASTLGLLLPRATPTAPASGVIFFCGLDGIPKVIDSNGIIMDL